ncbi:MULTISPECIES: PAS-domain containing protein [Alphaproteobacteria]|uniref:Sensory/regulatory protein RpfC n=2 Tax=Alphaproteobacteria TaxID=28211 RepID=A0A512HF38_9HYPH|nr:MULTISPECIES: PAS-domain containing protein [Alphaproteobacteria]GEO84058.1 chemotaxis protein CheY [Ciceribacter naphthalenivorans]GLR21064.1 chemotaxis protein CheY [Ciceribacter naphthalenivorans]GLT03920.1 chemotaxis protein CheY [Sphingomonas psychrolutea]
MNTGGDLLNIVCEKIAELEVPAFIKDSELRYMAVNDAYAAFFRERPDAFAGKTDRELFGPLEDCARDDRERQVVVFGDEQTTSIFGPCGHERYPLRLERFFGDDDAIYVFGMFEEAPPATSRPEVVEADPSRCEQPVIVPEPMALCCTDELFQATLEDLPVATYVRDADHRMVFVNSAFAEMVGLAKERLIGRTERECFPDRGDEYYAENSRTLEEGVATEQEDFFLRPDGTVVPVISRTSRIETASGDHYMVGSISDVSLLKIREAQLVEAQGEAEGLHRHVESLLKSMPVGMLILGADLLIEYANDEFYDMLEANERVDLTGWHYRDFLTYSRRHGGSGVDEQDVETILSQRLSQFNNPDYTMTSRAESRSGRLLAIRSKRLDSGKILITYSDITDLHQREQESVLYRTAIEQLPVPVFIRDGERRLIFANAAYEDLQGENCEQFYGLREDEMFPDMGDQLRQDNLHILETGEPLERSQELPMAKGRVHSVITRLNRIVTPGQQRYLVGSITDVSVLKARERELMEAQTQAQKLYADLENILRVMPVGVIILNEDLVIEFANPKTREIWEWPVERSLEGATFGDYARTNHDRGWVWEGGKDFDVGLDERITELRALEGTMQRELVYPDGKQVLITTTSLVDHKFLITYSDFTELRRQEREISEAREQLERIGQFMQDATRVMSQGLVVIEDGVIVQSNESLARMLAVPQAMLAPGQSWHACFAYCAKRGDFGADPMTVLEDWQEKVHSMTGFSATFLCNEQTWVQMEATASGHGHWMVVCTDVTDLKRRQEELTVLLARSEAADQAKSEFLANMSHEIRTPMNGVLGMAELLAKSALDTRQKTFVDIIVKSGNALLTIINDILDFSKIDAGQLKLRNVSFDPVEAIEDVATLLSTSAADKDIELIVRADASVRHMVSGDPGRFRQIVTNLLGNAIKFTEKGHVLVELSGTPLDGPQVMLTMRVEDTGIGIPDDKRISIFDKFSQVDTSSTRRHEGTGLGLAITAGLVNLFGGHIDVDSRVGEGSVFTVRMPFAVANERQKPQPLPVNVEGARILVIDDNDINRRILTEQLALWGFDGVAVDSGHEAMAVLDEAHRLGVSIDALIIDYQMPVMNGIDVARMIRADHRFEAIAMIFLTSMDMVGDERIFEKLNVQAHLMKPARANLLRSTIVEVVRAVRLGWPRGAIGKPLRVVSANSHPEQPSTRAVPATSGSALAAPPVRPTSASSGCDVLIAEDNEVNQIVFRQILQSTNLTQHIVENGREAVEAWRALQPRLIIMDISMPILNGHQAARTIREAEKAEGEGRHVPIIGVTAHALDSDREACLAAGMDDYLSKPVSPEQLEEKIERWLGRSLRDGSVFFGCDI